MKPHALLVVLILAAALPLPGQSAEPKDKDEVAKEFIRFEREWGHAIVARDTAAMERVLAEDYTLTTPEGRIVTRAMVLEHFKQPRDPSFEIQAVNLDQFATRIVGDMALVSSRFIIEAKEDGREVETPFRHTDVFVKHQGCWRCVARHATRISESPGSQGD